MPKDKVNKPGDVKITLTKEQKEHIIASLGRSDLHLVLTEADLTRMTKTSPYD